MDNNEMTFEQVKQALEVASRVEKMLSYIHQEKLDMTFKEDAAHRVKTDDVEDYVLLGRLETILYRISENAGENWRGTKIQDMVKNLKYYVR